MKRERGHCRKGLTHLGVTRPEAPLKLHSGYRVNSMRASNLVGAGLRDAQVFDLALLDQLLPCSQISGEMN